MLYFNKLYYHCDILKLVIGQFVRKAVFDRHTEVEGGTLCPAYYFHMFIATILLFSRIAKIGYSRAINIPLVISKKLFIFKHLVVFKWTRQKIVCPAERSSGPNNFSDKQALWVTISKILHPGLGSGSIYKTEVKLLPLVPTVLLIIILPRQWWCWDTFNKNWQRTTSSRKTSRSNWNDTKKKPPKKPTTVVN